jgi:hypothetical protein
VTWQGNRPSRAQRVTVFGDTPNSLETSDRVKNCVTPPSVACASTICLTVETVRFRFPGRNETIAPKGSLWGSGDQVDQEDSLSRPFIEEVS